MGVQYPTFDQRAEAIRAFFEWACNCNVVYGDESVGQLPRLQNQPWIELRLKRLIPIGVSDKRFEDTTSDPVALAAAKNPRQDIFTQQYELLVEARGKSREQTPTQSGFYALAKAQARAATDYANESFFSPNCLGFNRTGQVVNMNVEKVHDLRLEDRAFMEMYFNTAIELRDVESVGTYIEHVEFGIELRNAAGDLLDSTVQITDEEVP